MHIPLLLLHMHIPVLHTLLFHTHILLLLLDLVVMPPLMLFRTHIPYLPLRSPMLHLLLHFLLLLLLLLHQSIIVLHRIARRPPRRRSLTQRKDWTGPLPRTRNWSVLIL